MRKTKRILSVLICILIALSCAGPAFAAFPDVDAASPYAEAINLLQRLNVVGGDENGNFNPKNTIPRAEFSKILYVLYNGTPEAQKRLSAFPDNPAEAWFNGYVNWAADNKIVGGRDTGMFDPNAPVTVAEASKMFVVAITGDNTLAWPTGFEAKAKELGLYKGASYESINAPAARELVALLAANALSAQSVLLAASPYECFFDSTVTVEQRIVTAANNVSVTLAPLGKPSEAMACGYKGERCKRLCGQGGKGIL